MLNKKALMGSVSAPPSDQYFKNTVLLLHGDGTNGAQNNTFTDSSTNAYSITRVGNTTQGTFSPFSQANGYWSNFFDGNGDYLDVSTSTAGDFGTGDFTVEAWVYRTVGATSQQLVDNRPTNTAVPWIFYIQSTDKLRFYDGATNHETSTTVPVNQWSHVAVARSGTTLKLFIDGVEGLSVSNSVNLDTTASTIRIGNRLSSAGNDFSGYMSNVRIVKGTAVYTAAFTPPTSPLTAITNTSLLTCQSNRFVDNSTNASAITVYGDTSVQALSPFAPTASYSTTTVGGSGYFDGNGDYLETSSSVSLTGDFTLEAWIMQTDKTVNGGFFAIGDTITNSGTLCIYIDTNQLLAVYFNGSYEQSAGTTSPSGWNHCAVVRSGSSGYLYLNGTRVYSWTPGTTTISGAVHVSRAIASGNTYYSKGYVSSARILKGTALYTGSTYTVPTAPFTAIANTEFLCNFTNAGIIDNTAKNVLETVGNAQIDTATKKYGTGSLEFDGTGDYLVSQTNGLQNFGTGDFTVEAWIYVNSTSSTMQIVDARSAVAGEPWIFQMTNSGKLAFYDGSNTLETTSTISATTWTHVAACRSGSTLKLFINGTSGYSNTNSADLTNTGKIVTIGARVSGGTNEFNGYIDDLRITKGVARYTANFTAPTKAFEDQ